MIPAKISTEKLNKLEDRIRRVGTTVYHIKWGNGRIINVTETHITISFDSGKEGVFDIVLCIEKKLIRII